jgi:hypothetical protein
MRTGWSDKDAAQVLGVQPAKASQALTPAVLKMARLGRADLRRTLKMLLAIMDEMDAQDELDAQQSAACKLCTYKMRAQG